MVVSWILRRCNRRGLSFLHSWRSVCVVIGCHVKHIINYIPRIIVFPCNQKREIKEYLQLNETKQASCVYRNTWKWDESRRAYRVVAKNKIGYKIQSWVWSESEPKQEYKPYSNAVFIYIYMSKNSTRSVQFVHIRADSSFSICLLCSWSEGCKPMTH